MSLPHSIVAIPQARNDSAFSGFTVLLEKRQRATNKRACSSSAGSPDELTGKQQRLSPSLVTATRNRMVRGASSLEAAKFAAGTVGTPKGSNSFEKEADVGKTPIARAVVWRARGTAPGGLQRGMPRSCSSDGISFNVGSIAE